MGQNLTHRKLPTGMEGPGLRAQRQALGCLPSQGLCLHTYGGASPPAEGRRGLTTKDLPGAP